MVQKNCIKNKIIIICGPTASSKSMLAVETAKLLNGEIISADSMCVYKKLDIGTAKPTVNEMGGIVHHMINVVEPDKTFSVGDYREIAKPIVDELLSCGKIPIVCGGTGFYINSLLYDLSYGNTSGNLLAREKYKRLAENNGNDYVFDILKNKDPETAKKLHPNDLKRVIRALEIFENGMKKSDIKDDFSPLYDYIAYTVDYDRQVLYERIHRRIDKMLSDGLIDEVKTLINDGLTIENQCMQGIGYKEIYQYLSNEVSLHDAIELLKINTRHYAKRQITFFKKMPNLVYLPPLNLKTLAKKIVEDYYG